MIRLNLPREQRWLNLKHGVRVKVRPLTTAVYEAARIGAHRKTVQIAVDQGLIKAAGGTIADLPDSTDHDGLSGLWEMIFIQALGVHAIIEWEGVGEDDGAAAECTHEKIESLLREYPGVAGEFLAKYTEPMDALASEGNAFGAAQNGISAAAPNTVKDADPAEAHVPTVEREKTDGSAHTTNTN